MLKELIQLIQEKALTKGPCKLASGQTSDYYIDLSKVVFNQLGISLISDIILGKINWQGITSIGGPANGCIPLVSGVLSLTNVPMNGFYVRKKQKEHGQEELIEGNLIPGDKVVMIEDVTTTGNSLYKAVLEVQKIAEVSQIITVIDREQGAVEFFKEKNIPFKSVLSVSQIL